MKKIILPMRYVGMLAVALTLLSGCRKDLCYNHFEHGAYVRTELDATWEQVWERTYGIDWHTNWNPSFGMEYNDLTPDIPGGILATVYTDGKSENPQTLGAKGGQLAMSEGEHSILLYNNDTEFIVFDGLNNSATAKAGTRMLSRSTYSATHQDERTINTPDMLYAHYIESYIAERTVNPVQIEAMLQPLTYTYLIRYEFAHGLEYVALARGAMAGMANKIYLQDGHTDSEAATLLYDCTVEDFGTQAIIHSFGVPDFSGGAYLPGKETNPYYGLNLEVMLKNGKLINFDFDITEQVKAQPCGGVIIVKDIVISDDDGQEGSGGFDPDINDWGDYEDVELPLD